MSQTTWYSGPRLSPASNPSHLVDGLDLPEWMSDGVCSQTDPEAFYPEKGGSSREAKRVCLTCPVRTERLDYALEHGERFGIWGGLTERQRRKLLKAERTAP